MFTKQLLRNRAYLRTRIYSCSFLTRMRSAEVGSSNIGSKYKMNSTKDDSTDTSSPADSTPGAGRVDMLNVGMKNQVIVLSGCTAVGKSKVAQLLCRKLGNCEIVVADSVQVYNHLDIGSNKPSLEERTETPHHCVDMVSPHETYSCGDFVRFAVPQIYDILNRGNIPVIVGGSTMWIQWLVQGIPDAPKATSQIVSQAVSILQEASTHKNWSQALDILREYAPEKAETIGANDWYRAHRYLEVALSKKKQASSTTTTGAEAWGEGKEGDVEGSASQVKVGGAATRTKAGAGTEVGDTGSDSDIGGGGGGGEGEEEREAEGYNRVPALPGLDIRCFFLSEDREQLYRTIDQRCEAMLSAGLVQEVCSLIVNNQLTPETVAAKAIGYRQTIEYLSAIKHDQDKTALTNYIADFATATRNYAKRQLHWYRKDKDFLWMRIQRKKEDGQNSSNNGSAKDDGGDEAYIRIANELLHWTSVDREVYSKMLKCQVSLSDSVVRMRSWVKAKNGFKPRIQLDGKDWLALSALVACKEIKAPTTQLSMGVNGLLELGPNFGSSSKRENVEKGAGTRGSSTSHHDRSHLHSGGTGAARRAQVSRRQNALAQQPIVDNNTYKYDDCTDEDDFLEIASMVRQPTATESRSLPQRIQPEFPELIEPEWSAQHIMIRSSENSKGKQYRTPMAEKLRSYMHNIKIGAADCTDAEMEELRVVMERGHEYANTVSLHCLGKTKESAASLSQDLPLSLIQFFFPDMKKKGLQGASISISSSSSSMNGGGGN